MRRVAVSALILLGALAGSASGAPVMGMSHGEHFMHNDHRHVRTTGASGWIQFCNASESPNGTAPSDACVDIRPFGFFEADVNARVVSAPGTGQRRINNLYQHMTVSNATLETLPLCSANGSAVDLCGANDAGLALAYTLLPISIAVDTVTTPVNAALRIDVKLFESAGHFRYNGQNYSVTPGMIKFDIDVSSYALADPTNHVGFRLTVKENNHSAVPGSAPGAVTPVANGLVLNLPQYAVATSASGPWTWQDVDVSSSRSGVNTVIDYKFRGPFTQVRYDPIIATFESDTTSTTTTTAPAGPDGSPAVGVTSRLACVASIGLAVVLFLAGL